MNWWNVILSKVTSKKFVLTVVGMVVAILLIVLPQYKDEVVGAASKAIALLAALGMLWRYLKAEAEVDVARTAGIAVAQAKVAENAAMADQAREVKSMLKAIDASKQAEEAPKPKGVIKFPVLGPD